MHKLRLTHPPVAVMIASITWFVLMVLLQSTLARSVVAYERQLAVDYDLPAITSEATGEVLPIQDVTLETFDARRGVFTRMWAMWVLATFVPIITLIAILIATSQPPTPHTPFPGAAGGVERADGETGGSSKPGGD